MFAECLTQDLFFYHVDGFLGSMRHYGHSQTDLTLLAGQYGDGTDTTSLPGEFDAVLLRTQLQMI